ncbi:hypothetical protein HID58_003350, partial [Brassica napus]
QSSIVYDKKIVKIFWHHCSRQGGHKEIVWHNSWGLNTRLPYICTMPLKMDEGWNVHANCRLRRIYFAERLYSDEELPPEFKLYLPVQEFAIKAENTIIEIKDILLPMTRLAPSKVFLSSVATVIRPTPPGIPLEASEKSTSPTNRYPDFI